MPPGAQPERAGSGHLPALDGARGIAILIVLVHNTSFVLRGSDTFVVKLWGAVAATGWSGVSLFFVLSGFLITGILLDARGSPGFFRTFYARRTLRIFPLYYVFLALALLAGPVVARPARAAAAPSNQWGVLAGAANSGKPLAQRIPGLLHVS